MASGKFSSTVNTLAGSGYSRYIEVVWSSTNDVANNKSTITWTAYSRSNDSSTTGYVGARNIVVIINGESTTLVGSTTHKLYKDSKLGSGSIIVSHDSNGVKSVDVSITARIYTYSADNSNYTGTITMTRNPVYSLSISAGAGSNITVNRTSCYGYGETGELSAGTKKLCYGDKLKITFTPNANYNINSHTVNESNFTSGNTHTVVGDVSVVATATPLGSAIGATDANIGSASTITITRHNTSYTHTITYSFGKLTGTIVSKSPNTSFAWTIPTEFYEQIPDSKTGVCVLTCKTYDGNTSLGSSTCELTVTAAKSSCKPTIKATVLDTNATTKALTGDATKLIRYMSTATCTIEATAKNHASISSVKINNTTVTGTTSNGITTATKTYKNVSENTFSFSATDSRLYTASTTITPTTIAYVQLTCNPTVSRPTPTGSAITMTFTGNFYRGSFGAYSNTLTLQYRYKQSGGSYGSWKTIDSANISYGTSTYTSNSTITLGTEFDYRFSYVFQVRATDGTTEYPLSTATKTITVNRGIPIFDWGENDFNFNVPVNFSDTVSFNNGLKLFYESGDTVFLEQRDAYFAGVITDSAGSLRFTIPMSKPITATIAEVYGYISARGINGYVNGSDLESSVINLHEGGGFTVDTAVNAAGVTVKVNYGQAIPNAVNNTPITVMPYDFIVIVFS